MRKSIAKVPTAPKSISQGCRCVAVGCTGDTGLGKSQEVERKDGAQVRRQCQGGGGGVR